ncbi:cation:proton antiporter [Diaminobutyricibacter sp. McL0608]|uniref:cation:proton antiporter n=1 Tax=Leifsonia sp. McL0608 TaxID=3143537 RepID=UPI0031F2DC5F
MQETTLILIEIGALLLAMSLLGRLAIRIGISPIPFYLVLGLLFGEGGFLPLDASEAFFQVGAEIGVILLLALLGLEYTASELLTTLRRSPANGAIDGVMSAVPGAVLALVLGWGPVAAVALAGITWVSSSGVVAKMLRDLGRLGNRETPTVLAILVMEDLAMAFYLPVLAALLVGVSILEGAVAVAISVGVVSIILFIALRYGSFISRIFSPEHPEPLLLGVLGLTMLVAGVAQQVNVSTAVGAFLVGIALSGRVAQQASQVLTPLRDLFAAVFFVFFGLATDAAELVVMLGPAVALSVVTMGTKIATGYVAARRARIGVPGRWRAGLALTPRGEFSIVIAGLAVGSGIEPGLAPLATGYVLITVIVGPLLARIPDSGWFKAATRPRRAAIDG